MQYILIIYSPPPIPPRSLHLPAQPALCSFSLFQKRKAPKQETKTKSKEQGRSKQTKQPTKAQK